MTKSEKIYQTMTKLFNEKKQASWGEIVSVIKVDIKVKNWMSVRNVLQFMLNEKEIVRTNNIHEEMYVKVD